MTLIIYIMLGIFSALMLGGSVVVITKAGAAEGICKYGYEDETERN